MLPHGNFHRVRRRFPFVLNLYIFLFKVAQDGKTNYDTPAGAIKGLYKAW